MVLKQVAQRYIFLLFQTGGVPLATYGLLINNHDNNVVYNVLAI